MRTLAAVLLAAIVGVAPAASVAGDDPFGPDCPVLAVASERVLRMPPPGYTKRQWEMMWELARCIVFIDFRLHLGFHDEVVVRRSPDLQPLRVPGGD